MSNHGATIKGFLPARVLTGYFELLAKLPEKALTVIFLIFWALREYFKLLMRLLNSNNVSKDIADFAEYRKNMSEIRKGARKLAALARARGWDGSMITREDKEWAHKKLLKQKGFI